MNVIWRVSEVQLAVDFLHRKLPVLQQNWFWKLQSKNHLLRRSPGVVAPVEGFPATWWLTAYGFTDTVAVMGSECSDEQAKLILERVEFDGRIWIMSDGDEGGVRLAQSVFERVAPYRFVRWVKLQDGEQPTSLMANELAAVLTFDFKSDPHDRFF